MKDPNTATNNVRNLIIATIFKNKNVKRSQQIKGPFGENPNSNVRDQSNLWTDWQLEMTVTFECN